MLLVVLSVVCTRALLEAAWSVLGELLPEHYQQICFLVTVNSLIRAVSAVFFVICPSLKA